MQNPGAIVRRFVDVCLNKGDIESADQFFWDDVVEEVPLPGQRPGLAGLKDVLRGFRMAFPDLQFSIEEQIVQGNTVVSRFEWIGTHRGEFLGVLATGREVKVWGVEIDRFQGDKIMSTRIIMDVFGLMAQFGRL
jgi:steroid delta-isomerase-like uncharacterized protein